MHDKHYFGLTKLELERHKYHELKLIEPFINSNPILNKKRKIEADEVLIGLSEME